MAEPNWTRSALPTISACRRARVEDRDRRFCFGANKTIADIFANHDASTVKPHRTSRAVGAAASSYGIWLASTKLMIPRLDLRAGILLMSRVLCVELDWR
jgi:hypothetical protein